MELHDAHVTQADDYFEMIELEMAGDIATQYRSEVALYGDAGPGQGEAYQWAMGVYARADAKRRAAGEVASADDDIDY